MSLEAKMYLMARRFVDRNFPKLGRFYRVLRDSFSARVSFRTLDGFYFRGPPMVRSPEWEKSERQVIAQAIDISDVFIDVGANAGYYSCMAAVRGKTFLAIEPLISNVRMLKNNLLLNKISGVVLEVGLSDEVGELRIMGHGDKASFISGWAGVSDSIGQVVAVTTLDIALADYPKNLSLCIKMDVEGFERNVLRGARETLGRPNTVWIVEIFAPPKSDGYDHFVSIFNLFREHGYKIWAINNGLMPISIDKLFSKNLDYLAGSYNFYFSNRRDVDISLAAD